MGDAGGGVMIVLLLCCVPGDISTFACHNAGQT